MEIQETSKYRGFAVLGYSVFIVLYLVGTYSKFYLVDFYLFYQNIVPLFFRTNYILNNSK